MQLYRFRVDGMQCGMCESHINDAIRQAFVVKKVTSSHRKNETVVIVDDPLDPQACADVIQAAGYTVVSFTSEPYTKKGLFR